MGFNFENKAEEITHNRQMGALQGQRTKLQNQARRRLADRIVNVCIDTTVNQIIRPGPKPEERECYEMANELRELKTQMIDLVTEVLRISEEED